jgi:methyltransferase (TIGR00027 family)
MLRETKGPSGTAIAVAAFRASYTCAPAALSIVDDPFAGKLIPRPLGRLAAITRSRPRLGWAMHRGLALLSAEMSTNLALRTAAIDDGIRETLGRDVRQVVVLGSGLDARAWRMPELAPCSVFELDRPGAHAVKRRKLAGNPVRARRHRLVPIDFERQTIGEVLLAAGYEPSEPTLWLWEAVAVYLTPQAIERTFAAVAALSASGSTLMATYTPPNLGQGDRPTWHWRLAARIAGEPVRGEMATESLRASLSLHGFEVISDDTATQWAQRYWPASEGHHARGWERLVVAHRR